jgi:nucleoside-diphosphate-sugar epimerase
MKAFNALPWYHLHGLITSVQAMWMRKAAHLFNASLPLTADNLISALNAIQPEIVHSVPYVLKLIAEQDSGVETLKRCKRVTGAGARTPDELGDRLVAAGVQLGTIFGLTEVGHVGDSINREPGDDSWAYIRPYANIRKFIWFKQLNKDTYESVYLKGHPALMITNSDDPPGSFHSKDLFTPHPTVPDAWKYVARDDDRVTLINGEKILPLSMEGCLREDPLVRDCVLVGNDRPVPGMLIFRADGAAKMKDEDFIKAIWSSVEEANAIADEFARITPEMIATVPAGVEFPATDKGNIIRAQTYRVFADKIDALYERLEHGEALTNGHENNLQLSVPELEQFILDIFRDQAGVEVVDSSSDFFAAGVDSLRAIQVRRLLQKDLDLGGHGLPTNVVYDQGNATNLARHLYALRTGEGLTNGHHEREIETMQSMIQRFSNFPQHTPSGSPAPSTDTVVLTGATGTLGVHILAELLARPCVSRVYCLVRGQDPLSRVLTALKSRRLSQLPESAFAKLTAHTSDLSQPNLALDAATFAAIQSTTTLVIHAAWPVTFNVSLASFAPQLAGLHALLHLSLTVPHPRPARLLFASSVSTAFASPTPVIDEGPIPHLSHAADTGYARSKLVGERVCEAAAQRAARVGVLRIGQIVGDVAGADWNEKEAVPLMVRGALVLRALPALRDTCEWIPVDVAARTVLELAERMQQDHADGVNGDQGNGVNGSNGVETNGVGGAGANGVDGRGPRDEETDIVHPAAWYYNIVAPSYFDWTSGFLPALRDAGLEFKTVSTAEWVELLRTAAEDLGAEAEKKIPAAKLIDYYSKTFEEQVADGPQAIRFKTSKTCADSEALRKTPDVVTTGLAKRFLQVWLTKWT